MESQEVQEAVDGKEIIPMRESLIDKVIPLEVVPAFAKRSDKMASPLVFEEIFHKP